MAREKYRESIRESQRRTYLNNPEKKHARARRAYAKNPQKVLKLTSEYRQRINAGRVNLNPLALLNAASALAAVLPTFTPTTTTQ